MMEYTQIAKQAVDFQKNLFESTYDTVARIQDQTVEAVDTLMNQANLVPEEGRQLMNTFVKSCQEGRDRFKSYVEEGFSGLEKRFALESKTGPEAIFEPKN